MVESKKQLLTPSKRVELKLSLKSIEMLLWMKDELQQEVLADTIRSALRLQYEVLKWQRSSDIIIRNKRTGKEEVLSYLGGSK